MSLPVLCKVAAAAAKSFQSCPTLCDPINGSSPGSSVPGILLARILENPRDGLGAHWVDSRESSLLRRLERGREIGL